MLSFRRCLLTKVNLELSPREEIAALVPSLSIIPNIVKHFLRNFYILNIYKSLNCYYLIKYYVTNSCNFCKKSTTSNRLIHDFITSWSSSFYSCWFSYKKQKVDMFKYKKIRLDFLSNTRYKPYLYAWKNETYHFV